MIVLLTGGGGYLGSTLAEMLLDHGYGVRVLDRFFFGEDILEAIKDRENLCLIKGDIRCVGEEVFTGVDTVIDLAALSNDPSAELDPQKTMDINYLGRSRIAHMAKLAGVRRYILASSCSIYGFQEGILNEESPVNPLTTYAQANYLAEQAVLLLFGPRFSVVVLRQATLYGLSRRMRFDLAVNGMTSGIYNTGEVPVLRDGNQWRPFMHVRDACRAFIMAMKAPGSVVNGQVFNVGSNSQNIQIGELAQRVAQAVDRPLQIEWYGDPDHRSYQVNFDKIAGVLGFHTELGFEDGAREIYEALNKGQVITDERSKTVVWYRTLLDWKKRLDSILDRGEVL
ncbi:MAG: NAD-dependent epimerase/dehydratase family protein [Syntrophomonas sp.]